MLSLLMLLHSLFSMPNALVLRLCGFVYLQFYTQLKSIHDGVHPHSSFHHHNSTIAHHHRMGQNRSPFNLPEIATLVAQHLEKKDLARCILVNKTWHALFVPFLW